MPPHQYLCRFNTRWEYLILTVTHQLFQRHEYRAGNIPKVAAQEHAFMTTRQQMPSLHFFQSPFQIPHTAHHGEFVGSKDTRFPRKVADGSRGAKWAFQPVDRLDLSLTPSITITSPSDAKQCSGSEPPGPFVKYPESLKSGAWTDLRTPPSLVVLSLVVFVNAWKAHLPPDLI